MLHVLIVDDEERASDSLRLMLERLVPQVQKIAVCTDARLAAEMIRSFRPHLVFMDIKMPHLSGFEVLQQIAQHDFRVIFTTAFNEFMIKAIRFSAFDYLLKPVDAEELLAAVNRYLSLQQNNQKELLANMWHNITNGQQLRLTLQSREGVFFLEPADLQYCEALNNYTRFYTTDGRQFLSSKTLGDYQEMLEDYGFLRCHRSYLVNKSAVSYLDPSGYIVLKNGVRLEISKRRRGEIVRLLAR